MRILKDMRRMALTGRAGLVAGICAAGLLGVFSSVAKAGTTQSATETVVKAETREVKGVTIATIDLSVSSDADDAASGVVTLMEHGRAIAGAALNADGKVTIKLDGLAAGDHSLQAVYAGDKLHAASKSEALAVHSNATVTPDFALGISQTTMTIAAPGDAGSLIATVTPVAGTGFTGFISLSCSGPPVTTGAPGGSALPFGVSCTYSPANLEVAAATTANPTGGQSANLSIQTTAPSGQSTANGRSVRSPLVLAILLPGIVGLGYLGRKRGVFSRARLLLVFGVITLLGASACAPRYKYYHHPPTYNPGTVAGDYTITVTAQTSDGVKATEHTQTLALTVK